MREPGRDYAAPLSALDEVIRLDADCIQSVKRVRPDEPYFRGHYPGNPIYPGVFIFEAVHQAVRHYGETYHDGRLRLSHIKSIRFLEPVLPGDVLETECIFDPGDNEESLVVKAVCSKSGVRVSRMTLYYRVEAAS